MNVETILLPSRDAELGLLERALDPQGSLLKGSLGFLLLSSITLG